MRRDNPYKEQLKELQAKSDEWERAIKVNGLVQLAEMEQYIDVITDHYKTDGRLKSDNIELCKLWGRKQCGVIIFNRSSLFGAVLAEKLREQYKLDALYIPNGSSETEQRILIDYEE